MLINILIIFSLIVRMNFISAKGLGWAALNSSSGGREDEVIRVSEVGR